ncbi:dynein light chain Tctex-type protein 2B isoform X2 [Microcebus murinus]|uniref:dynein light chain Tctex-type protein 2B isoform X2 n=1 Tax=Microcebus murinus TaxID=30608 RepID=UPI003F6C6C6B
MPRTPTFCGRFSSKGGFRPSVVKECIHAVLKEELANAEYSPEETPQLTKHLSENIKDKLKEMGFDRYKMVVQVVIGEQRGEGVLPGIGHFSKEPWFLLLGNGVKRPQFEETRSPFVAQAGLELLVSSNAPILASQSAGITAWLLDVSGMLTLTTTLMMFS